MTRTSSELSASENTRAQELAAHQSEVEKLKDRIRALEGSNSALEKAINHLNDLNGPKRK